MLTPRKKTLVLTSTHEAAAPKQPNWTYSSPAPPRNYRSAHTARARLERNSIEARTLCEAHTQPRLSVSARLHLPFWRQWGLLNKMRPILVKVTRSPHSNTSCFYNTERVLFVCFVTVPSCFPLAGGSLGPVHFEVYARISHRTTCHACCVIRTIPC